MFFANIYSFAHCSYLKISSSAATYLNSTFWAGFGIGRFLGIFLSKFLTATQYIIVDVIGILISTILLDVFTESNLILWGSVFCYGLFVASLYSCQSSEFKKKYFSYILPSRSCRPGISPQGCRTGLKSPI